MGIKSRSESAVRLSRGAADEFDAFCYYGEDDVRFVQQVSGVLSGWFGSFDLHHGLPAAVDSQSACTPGMPWSVHRLPSGGVYRDRHDG
jgi:hypothetical protein